MSPGLRKLGWAYICYHLVLLLVGLHDSASHYWSIGDFLGELTVGFILYAPLAPALTLCGVHDACESAGWRIMQLLLLGLGICWAIVGWRVALSTAWRWARRHQVLGK